MAILLPVALFLLYYYTLPIMILLGCELFALNEETNEKHSIRKPSPLMGLARMIYYAFTSLVSCLCNKHYFSLLVAPILSRVQCAVTSYH